MPLRRALSILTIWAVFCVTVIGFSQILENDSVVGKRLNPLLLHGFIDATEPLPPLVRWDSVWYYALARDGYWGTTERSAFTAAFYPLYPLVVRGVHELTQCDLFTAGIVVAALALLGFLLLLDTYIATLVRDKDHYAPIAMLLYLLFPGAFMLLSMYHCSLFALLLIATFVAFRRDKPLLAALCAALASMTHMHALALTAALFVVAVQRRTIRGAFPCIASLSGHALVALHHYLFFGDAFQYVEAKKFFTSTFQNPLHVFSNGIETFTALFQNPTLATLCYATSAICFVVVIGTALLMVYRERGMLLPEATLLLGFCLIQFSTGVTWGFSRFSLGLFPLFVWWAARIHNRMYALCSVTIVLALLHAAHIIHWISWAPPAP